MAALESCLREKEYERAREIALQMGTEELTEELQRIAFDLEWLDPYGFVCYLIAKQKQESSDLHIVAWTLLVCGLNHTEDAYLKAYYHAKKAIELDPVDGTNNEMMLMLYQVPGSLVSREEAVEALNRLLAYDSKNKAAHTFMRLYPDFHHRKRLHLTGQRKLFEVSMTALVLLFCIMPTLDHLWRCLVIVLCGVIFILREKLVPKKVRPYLFGVLFVILLLTVDLSGVPGR
ncbi:hypothetical protein JJB07_21095 [Tumebacillus sp. ITR2]|uniref:Tetratricopeptide repeat protein n=1 Tax=Tumebacillus amylolyticus TaxID=2801339 RepID=A0ABS1JFM8_9BACL|nr:hypothetical protein [Tumebacillus amylolyticus]MBL0389094.1 hypothetical protein [Tumebacillus amylolyticus]